jgi:hypothetical protein
MTEKNNVRPAFPVYFGENYEPEEGMSLRDYFAAKAMQAIISKKPFGVYETFEERDERKDLAVAYGAYFYADAMLKAREK